jgi:DedD protein
MVTATSEDTEITLGTGKMLALFFGLVVVCALFFGMGFSLGRNSAKPTVLDASAGTIVTAGGARPSAVKSTPAATPPADMTFYKAVGNKDVDSQLATTENASNPPDTNSPPTALDVKNTPADPAAAPPLNGYYVQVAAVSKQEDAEALVDALKKKDYPAFANTAADKLFHVQVGPYAEIKDAETMRTKLISDGYNPILKK